jgi:hypothetical protein
MPVPLSAITTAAPWAWRLAAMARPMPRPPPVTKAVRPFRFSMIAFPDLTRWYLGRAKMTPEVPGRQ